MQATADKIQGSAGLLTAIKSGRMVALVEYRNFLEARNIEYRDKKTGQARTFPSVKHGVELGGAQASFEEVVERGADVTKYVSPYKKGQTVLVEITGYQSDFSGVKLKGSVLGEWRE